MERIMKDSGIEWIGQIPEEWQVCHIKNIAEVYTGNSIKDEEKQNYEDSADANPYISSKDIDATLQTINYGNGMYVKRNDRTFKKAPFQSILLCIEGGSAGKKIAFTNQEVCFVNKLCNFHTEEQSNKYLYYFMMSPAFTLPFSSHISGLIGGVSVSELKNFVYILPPLPEQQKIADFLDAKCAEIDNVISKTEATIEEYKKLKQSVITEAVTKGIRGDRPMKDSGIEWIGEIPEEWEISRIKYISEFQPTCDISKLNEDSVITYTPMENIKNGYFIQNTAKLGSVSASLTQYCEGDIVIAKVTPCFENGNIAIMEGLASGFGLGSSELFVLRCTDVERKYLFYWLQNTIFMRLACSTMTGTGGLKRVSPYFVKNCEVHKPSVEEQQKIADYLDSKCSEIDKLIDSKQKLLEELQQYKKSIIYEYVTGKKEVV